jgi:hypothetical protein
MSARSGMGNDFFTKIIDPENPSGDRIDAIIPHFLIEKYYTFHPTRYENLRAAKRVLENPLRIFSGVRAFTQGGWCFTGRPAQWHIKETVVAPFPYNLVYAVYLNTRYFVYECRAEKAATDDSECPEDWRNRYEALIWKNTS